MEVSFVFTFPVAHGIMLVTIAIRNLPMAWMKNTVFGIRCHRIEVFYLEYGCSTFLRNIGDHLPNYTASHPRRPDSS
jgi:hypothetical protein